ncbi:MAG: hypothetical protein JWP81_4206 [Ferruginibacter sp.]|nr:hypothetical protein [Ferruginibacter sp.]
MCGIAGVLHFDAKPVEKIRLIQMRDILQHRGPDDVGLWIDNYIGLAHRRLSIIDLSSGGHQPFFSADGNLVMVYNGELYNYAELRKELEWAGFQFTTHSDTEILLAYYRHIGPLAFERFNGMFALAIWDKQRQELFVARDRVGVKPLYYTINDNGFYFASEPKALIKYGIDPSLNESCFDELLAFRFIAGENTIFKHIKRLLPGHYATITPDRGMKITRWWHLGEKIRSHAEIKKPFEWFVDTFNSSIKYRMISDVKVGVLLSAGLDSTSVTRVLKNNDYDNIETFNVGFKHKGHDESSLAEKFCNELDYKFNKIYVENGALASYVEDASYFSDEPLIHLNDPHILAISKLAKSKVSVLLSGEGADEFMGGYVRYKTFQYQHFWPVINTGLNMIKKVNSNSRLNKLAAYLSVNNTDIMMLMNGSNIFTNEWIDTYKLYGMNFLPEYRLKTLAEAKTIYPGNSLRQLLYLDQHTYLQSLNDRNDRATMGASIECREPFMDYRLMEGIGTLNDNLLFKGKKNKFLLANTIAKTLPDYIQKLRKIGFSVPWRDYILNDEYFRTALEDLEKSDIFKQGILSKLNVSQLKKEFIVNGQHTTLIIQLVFIYIWYSTYFSRISNS